MDNQHAGFETAADAIAYMMGGHATFTLTSAKTGIHFTYKIHAAQDGNISFASVLNGPDNWENYRYIGLVDATYVLRAGKKGLPDAPSFKALAWTLFRLQRGNIPEDLTIQHEGRCCACARRLTHPDSIARGIGPECAKHA